MTAKQKKQQICRFLQIKSDLETYKNFKGSRLEKDFALMCKRRGINYSKVPDDEKIVVMRFLRRSKNFKGYYD